MTQALALILMSTPHFNQRFELPLKAVLIRCLNEEKKPTGHGASGFIRQEGNNLYLYTCWHVVTGYDKNDLKVRNELPNRAFLEIELKDAQKPQPGVETIGGIQSLVVPLYDPSLRPKKPLWHQDKRHIPHADLNAIGLFVPFWHDVVKIELPQSIRLAEMQVIPETDIFPSDSLLLAGDKLYVVGYPYGYSAGGAHRPTPVVLTRFVAATEVHGRRREILLESIGAPAMSGGPVFVEREAGIYLLGLYTGLLFPDHVVKENNLVTALGTCSDLTLCFRNYLPLVKEPSEFAQELAGRP